MVNPVTAQSLEGYVGKNINQICGNGYAAPGDNHCAHFVSHVLGLQRGLTCAGMARGATQPGASIRCQELYNALPQRGVWGTSTGSTDGLLIFAIGKGNVRNNQMSNVPRKHVGIVCGGKVYNYGNADDAVRCELTVEAFRLRMGRAYHDNDIGLFFAVPM